MSKIRDFILYILVYLPMVVVTFLLFRVFNRLKVRGKELLPRGKGMLIMANHVSALDSWLIGHIFFPRKVLFPAKAELFKIFFMRLFISANGAFPVFRGRYNERAMQKICELSQNHIVVMHPEGTRSLDGKIGKGMRGVGKIIYDSNAVVVPLVADGMLKFLPKGKVLPGFFNDLRIVIGKPVDFSEYKKREPSNELYAEMVEKLMHEMRKLAPEMPLE